MTKPRTDRADAEFYTDPANQIPAGQARPRKVPRRPLTGHVPVRFDDKTIASVKERAEAEGMTVSAWIRRLVARELAPVEIPAPGSDEDVIVRIPAGTRRVALELEGAASPTRRQARS